MITTRFGMVHGRFQPFHNEHLDYVLKGLARSDKLIIGITNPEPSEFILDKASEHRHLPESNPYTYFQRHEMIVQCIEDCKIDLKKITIIPFHLFNKKKWSYYLPRPDNVVQYVRVFSDWEEKKIELFKKYGFSVNVLDRNAPKNVEATQVRKKFNENGNWKELVPPGTVRVIDLIQKGLL